MDWTGRRVLTEDDRFLKMDSVDSMLLVVVVTSGTVNDDTNIFE